MGTFYPVSNLSPDRRETLLVSGRIPTDPGRGEPIEAVAGDTVPGGGSRAHAERLVGPGARAVDMRGRTILPAFVESHTHFHREERHLRRMQALGLAWSTQPAFRNAYAREWADVFPGERRERLMPIGLGASLGIPLLFNSDNPCAPVDPVMGIRAATEPAGTWGPHARVSRVEAWRAFTVTLAEVANEPRLGRLTAGALADLVAFDEDPLLATTDLTRVVVRATMVAGWPVYGEREVFE